LDKKLPNSKQAELDPAAQAFEALHNEVLDLRRSINQLTDYLQTIPTQDYRKTLAEILRAQNIVSDELKDLKSHPAINLTPEGFINKLEEIKERSLERERKSLKAVADTLRSNSNTIGHWIDQAREANQQTWRLVQIGSLGIILGGAAVYALKLF